MTGSAAQRLTLKEIVAMGVGGMIGGGIFSVLGLAVAQAGHAAPLAFALGGVVALVTGAAYARLGVAFESDGGSFTYLEKAFAHPNVGGIAGWLLLAGYIGTLGLYAYTFGAYGSAMAGDASATAPAMHHLLESLVLLAFLGINLYGVKASGTAELLIVTVKVLILLLFSIIGLFFLRPERLLPVMDHGALGTVMGAALIFVAYEGFELIPNAVNEMENPRRNLGRGIFWSIGVTIFVYVLVSLVAEGNLTPDQIAHDKEYALAVAAEPFLGRAGYLLIGLAALFSTASAINATLFGTARLGKVMARERELPKVFAFSRKGGDIPWVSLTAITLVTLALVNLADLSIIASFSSSTFLLIFLAIHVAAWRLRRRIVIHPAIPLIGMAATAFSWLALMAYLYQQRPENLLWIGCGYGTVLVAELGFSERRLFKRD